MCVGFSDRARCSTSLVAVSGDDGEPCQCAARAESHSEVAGSLFNVIIRQ
jgi:hypothetical protein